MKKTMLILMGLSLLFPSIAFAEKAKPMAARANVTIPDGEKLTYGIYTAGVKSSEGHFVTVYQPDGTIREYVQIQRLNSPNPLPSDYHKYSIQAVVDLKTGTMLHYVYNNEDYIVKQNKGKGIFYLEITINSEILALEKSWDGYEVREKKYRVRNIDPSFPIMNNNTFLVLGARMLNWDQPNSGVLYVWETMFKDPIPATLFKMRDETIKAPLDTFQTDKVGWKISDPFLGALIKQLTDSITFNIEKGPKKRAIFVDNQTSGEKWYLEKDELVEK